MRVIGRARNKRIRNQKVREFMNTKMMMCVLALAVLPLQAAELVDWRSGQAQDVAKMAAPIRVVNLWATWCVPCRKEMPLLSAWAAKQPKNKVGMVGIALDDTANIAAFLKTTPVRYPIWRYDGQDSRLFMKGMGNEVGGLPFTLVSAKGCGFRQILTGEVTAKKLNDAVAQVETKCRVVVGKK